jgi:hypothetical protein
MLTLMVYLSAYKPINPYKVASICNCKATLSAVTDPLRDYGRFIKITDKNSIIMAVGGAIVGLLSVIMKKT